MKTLFAAAAAALALSAAPVLAAPMDEVAQDKNLMVRVVSAPPSERGAGRIVNGETDGLTAPARADDLRIVQRPTTTDINHGGGR